MKKLICFTSLILSIISFVSCNNDIDGPTKNSKIESITETDIVIMPNAQSLIIEYRSGAKCRVEIDEEAMSWISCGSIDDNADCVTLDIDKNADVVNRCCSVRIVSERNSDIYIEYTITQYADDSCRIYYTTTDGKEFRPEYEDKFTNGFGVDIKSHTYERVGVIEFCGDALSTAVFVHAQVIDIEALNVTQHRIILHFFHNAEAVTQKLSIFNGAEDGTGLILQQLCQVGFVIFLGTGTEQVGSDLMVDFSHLPQQVNHTGNFVFCGQTNLHTLALLIAHNNLSYHSFPFP